MYFRNLRMDYHCLSFIPQSAVYLRRRSSERSLSLACPCQGLGRSTTMYIIAQLLVAKILPSFPPHPQRSGWGGKEEPDEQLMSITA